MWKLRPQISLTKISRSSKLILNVGWNLRVGWRSELHPSLLGLCLRLLQFDPANRSRCVKTLYLSLVLDWIHLIILEYLKSVLLVLFLRVCAITVFLLLLLHIAPRTRETSEFEIPGYCGIIGICPSLTYRTVWMLGSCKSRYPDILKG